MKNKGNIIKILAIMFVLVAITILSTQNTEETILTSAQGLSTKKIGWGIKRNDNHKQPDLGKLNKELIEKNNGIAMGNNSDKGYEAGYTQQILATLKNNNVTATFFITAHYLNTQPELVKQMIDEGHIVRKSYCKS